MIGSLRSDVEPLRNVSLLQVKHLLLSLIEILLCYLHSPLPQRNQTSLSTHRFYISTRKIVFCLDQIHNFHLS